MSRRSRLESLRALSESPNPHEAALARKEAERLQALQPVSSGPPPPGAYPHQLPGAFRVPTPLEGRP